MSWFEFTPRFTVSKVFIIEGELQQQMFREIVLQMVREIDMVYDVTLFLEYTHLN